MPELRTLTTEKPNSFWIRVYLAVVVTTAAVIAALWTFAEYFS